MSDIKNQTKDSVSPSLEGGKGWVSILKVLIAVLTALAGSLGVVSCTKTAPSNSPKGEDSVIADNIMPCHYENTFIPHEV